MGSETPPPRSTPVRCLRSRVGGAGGWGSKPHAPRSWKSKVAVENAGIRFGEVGWRVVNG